MQWLEPNDDLPRTFHSENNGSSHAEEAVFFIELRTFIYYRVNELSFIRAVFMIDSDNNIRGRVMVSW